METTIKKVKGKSYSFDPNWGGGKGAWRELTAKGKLRLPAKKELQDRWGNPNEQGMFEPEKTKESEPTTNSEKLKKSVEKSTGLQTYSSLLSENKSKLGSATLKYVKQQFRPEVLAKSFFGDTAGVETARALGVSKERLEAVKKGYDGEENKTRSNRTIKSTVNDTPYNINFKNIEDYFTGNKTSLLKTSSDELKKIREKLYGENTIAVKFSRTSESSKDLDTIADYFENKRKKEDIEDNFAKTQSKEQISFLKKISNALESLKSVAGTRGLPKEETEGGEDSGGISIIGGIGGGKGKGKTTRTRAGAGGGRLGRFFKGLGAAAGLGAAGAAGAAAIGSRTTPPETRTTADVDNKALLEAEDAKKKAALEVENSKKTIEKINQDNAKAIADVEQKSKAVIEKIEADKVKAIQDAEQKSKAAIEKIEVEKAEIDKKTKEAIEKANADKNMAVQEKEKAIADANAEKEKAIAETNAEKEKAIKEAEAEKQKTVSEANAEKEKAIKEAEAEKQKAISEINEAKEKAIKDANEKVSAAEAELKKTNAELEKVRTTQTAAAALTPEAPKAQTAAAALTPEATKAQTAAAALTPEAPKAPITPTAALTAAAAPTAGSKVTKAASKILNGLGPVGDIIGIALAMSAIEAARNNANAAVMNGTMSEDDAEKQFKKRTVGILSGEIGGFAGGVLGAIAGQMLIPIPILGGLIGGVAGGIGGGLVGEAAGEKLYDFLSTGNIMPNEDKINDAKKMMYESRKGMAGYDEYGAKKADADVMRLRESLFGMELTGNIRRKQQETERYEKEKEDAMRVLGAPGATPAPERTRAPTTEAPKTPSIPKNVESMGLDEGMMGALLTPASFTKPETTNLAEKVSTTPRTDDQQLGFMAKQYESGKMGTSAIGFDKTGGSSYGAYQIATKTGTMDRFMSYLKENNPEAYERLSKAGDPNVAGGGNFGKEWKKLAEEGKLQASEKDFIKKTHYDVGMSKVKDEGLQKMIGESQALQEVMWSTSVQHGGGGAGQIFNKVYKPGMSQEDLIKGIYAERGTKFGSSTPEVQQSVLNRFQKEQQQALSLASQPQQTPTQMSPQGGNEIPTQMTADAGAAIQRTTGPIVQNKSDELSTNRMAATAPIVSSPVTNNNIVNNMGGGSSGSNKPNADVRNTEPAFMFMQHMMAAFG